MESLDKFEEYKLFAELTDRLSDRRQKISNTYLTVNSIIIGVIAFLIKDTDLLSVVVIMPLIIGIIACIVWKQIMYKYKKLITHRIEELREIENHVDMKNCHKMYHAEDKLYPRDENGVLIKGKSLNLIDKEAWLPNIFIITYSVFLVGIIFYIAFKFFK
jgi:amino acid permease